MLERFEGAAGRRLRIEALKSQKLVAGNAALAEELVDQVELMALQPGHVLIEQGAHDNDVYLILSGRLNVMINGRLRAERGPNDHVGEMAAIEPSQRRSASIVAAEQSVVAKVTEPQLTDLAIRHPEIYRCIARELARRLAQRNAFVKGVRDEIRVFIICSTEALPIARIIQSQFAHDKFLPVIWSDGVFKVTNYTLQDLEDEVDQSDFAIAIAHADDETEFRGTHWPSPRDNVIFELGLFMGRLGRHRAILMEPRDEKVKLPSDLAGITTITYRYEAGPNAAALMGPACNVLRDHIYHHGPNN